MAYAKLQQDQGNQTSNMLGTGGLTGNAESTGTDTQAAKSPSGSSGGFTNIQDYMNANKGDTTNQNYLNTAGSQQIDTQANKLNTAISSAPAINTGTAASESGLNDILSSNDYETAKTNATNPTFDTSYDIADIYTGTSNPTSKLNGDMSGVMSYMGSLKPESQGYTGGMQKFDEMLLGGDQNFAKDFTKNKQDEYKTKVEDPYGAATAARAGQEATAKQNATDWQNQMKTYLSGVESARQKGIADTAQKQKDYIASLTGMKPELRYTGAATTNYGGTGVAYNPGDAFKATDRMSSPMNSKDWGIYEESNPYGANYTPSEANAETEYYNTNNLGDTYNDYNALADILGGTRLNTPNETFEYKKPVYTQADNKAYSAFWNNPASYKGQYANY